jgi:CheY-like chemotaxis protein
MVESGHVFLSLEAISLGEVLDECHSMIGPDAEQHGIRLDFPQLVAPCIVRGDRVRIKQVLLNLLSNAIKYNRPDGWIEVSCMESPPDRVRIQVRDSGMGLSAEQLARLFEPFNRLGQEAGTEQGTGIGLVTAKRLVELMHGAIGVDSVVGEGSVFWMDLPPATTAARLAELPQAMPGPVHAVDGQQRVRTLLYVEDNPANLMLVQDLIARRCDLHLLSARDGHTGVQIAREAHPDVILMDINLPGICGITALQLLRTDPATAHIPVVALSANALPRDIRRGLDAGFYRYLTKPIKVTELMDTLDTALRFAQDSVDATIAERSA